MIFGHDTVSESNCTIYEILPCCIRNNPPPDPQSRHTTLVEILTDSNLYLTTTRERQDSASMKQTRETTA
jgi:hypothetical protein